MLNMLSVMSPDTKNLCCHGKILIQKSKNLVNNQQSQISEPSDLLQHILLTTFKNTLSDLLNVNQ